MRKTKGSLMAIYHLCAKIIKRSEGRSAVAAAAYRCGANFFDERTGEAHNYTKKSGVFSVVSLAPNDAPAWSKSPAMLWNKAEATEKRKDAQLAREIDLAIPRELNDNQKMALVVSYAKKNFIDAGMCATVAFHDFESKNPHAHIMLTTRTITAAGFGAKNRDWNDVERLQQWREEWALTANAALELIESKERIDHRSHAARGLVSEPSKHQGPTAAAMTKRGLRPDRLRPMIIDAYEYAREVVADIVGSFQARISVRRERSPFDVRPPEMPLTPSPPWAKPPH